MSSQVTTTHRKSAVWVDIAAVREDNNQRIISNIALIDPVYNIADPLTKIIHSPIQEKVMPVSH